MTQTRDRTAAGRRRRIPIMPALALLIAGICGYWAWNIGVDLNREWFPVRFVRIQGSIQNLDMEKLQETLAPAVNAGYFSLDIGEIEGAARSCAWVEGVQVTRVWPDMLVINISEHEPVARWGDKAMLDRNGERFTPDRVDDFVNLPVLYGPPGMEHDLLRILKQLNERLAPQGYSVASLDVSKRRAWTLRLVNGPEMRFGRREPVEALDHFLGLVGKLGDNRLSQLLRVDLRYPNGFAVVWRPETESVQEWPYEPAAVFNPLGKATVVALEKQ